jgi:hypothetical protein
MTGDNDHITLADAAAHFGFTWHTLRLEIDRGRLVASKVGKRYYTTPNAIRAMVDLCRVEPKGQGFTVTRRAVNTSSETDRASLDSAQQALLKLRSTSRNTSRASTVQPLARVR